jgi:hypothetical protein
VKRFVLFALLTLTACGGVARGDGVGVGMLAAPGGVTAAGSQYRYIAVSPNGAGKQTVVEQVKRDGGRLKREWYLNGQYYVPAVAYDGSAGGLSADGGTLVLTRFTRSYPPRVTRFAVLDADPQAQQSPRPPRHRDQAFSLIALHGFYSFDAISPDGATIYLIHLHGGRAGADYEVRALDTASGRLRPGAVIDPSEADEPMNGLPISRATSPDGRWAYTLYQRDGEAPFLHALDTVAGKAVCVDLPQLEGLQSPFMLKLALSEGGRRLVVFSNSSTQGNPPSSPMLDVDTRTFAISRPDSPDAASSGGLPAWLAVGLAAALAAGLIWIIARRQRTPGAGSVEHG